MPKNPETLAINLKEAKLALKGVSELDYTDDGADFCSKLEKFIDEQKGKHTSGLFKGFIVDKERARIVFPDGQCMTKEALLTALKALEAP